MEFKENERCDIIIPVWNNLEITRDCLTSIKEHTAYPYRLVIIDNGSEEETAKYLDSLTLWKYPEVALLRNKENQGFIKAVNQGMMFSDAEYMCILNNDTIVTEGWISEMISVLRSDSLIGIINPSSNTSGQFPGTLKIDDYAGTLKHSRGKFQELYTCRAFAMIIKREVIDKIGYLDEGYGVGYFDDTDYCLRARQKGYKTVRAKASYVYHRESQSFSKLKERTDIFNENEKRFISKWGRRLRIAYVISNILKSKERERISSNINAIARIGHQVWIFTRSHTGIEEYLIDHDSIRFFYYPKLFFGTFVLYKIWKRKKKKKLHVILTNDGHIYKSMIFFKKFLKADIFLDNNFSLIKDKIYLVSHAN